MGHPQQVMKKINKKAFFPKWQQYRKRLYSQLPTYSIDGGEVSL